MPSRAHGFHPGVDFPLAAQRKPDEVVIFPWITWPSCQVRDEGTTYGGIKTILNA
jgi:uncharacterized protein YbaA (DUF1428 family)